MRLAIDAVLELATRRRDDLRPHSPRDVLREHADHLRRGGNDPGDRDALRSGDEVERVHLVKQALGEPRVSDGLKAGAINVPKPTLGDISQAFLVRSVEP